MRQLAMSCFCLPIELLDLVLPYMPQRAVLRLAAFVPQVLRTETFALMRARCEPLTYPEEDVFSDPYLSAKMWCHRTNSHPRCVSARELQWIHKHFVVDPDTYLSSGSMLNLVSTGNVDALDWLYENVPNAPIRMNPLSESGNWHESTHRVRFHVHAVMDWFYARYPTITWANFGPTYSTVYQSSLRRWILDNFSDFSDFFASEVLAKMPCERATMWKFVSSERALEHRLLQFHEWASLMEDYPILRRKLDFPAHIRDLLKSEHLLALDKSLECVHRLLALLPDGKNNLSDILTERDLVDIARDCMALFDRDGTFRFMIKQAPEFSMDMVRDLAKECADQGNVECARLFLTEFPTLTPADFGKDVLVRACKSLPLSKRVNSNFGNKAMLERSVRRKAEFLDYILTEWKIHTPVMLKDLYHAVTLGQEFLPTMFHDRHHLHMAECVCPDVPAIVQVLERHMGMSGNTPHLVSAALGDDKVVGYPFVGA